MSRKKWLLGSGSKTFVITRGRDLFPEEQETLPPGVFSAHVDLWLADARSRQALLDICESITGRAAAAPTRTAGNDLWRNLKPQLEGSFRRGELVILPTGGGDVFRTLEEPEPTPPPPVAPQRKPPPEPETSWVTFKVVEDSTGVPISNISLDIRLPKGEKTSRATMTSGLIDFPDLEKAGTCDVASVFPRGARTTQTFGFVTMGEAPTNQAKPEVRKLYGKGIDGQGACIALVEAHKVKKGESILSLAKTCDMTWQDLAKFNWGTSVPEEINEYLRDYVGCTKKTADGYNYMFTDSDEPGIMYLPKKWEQKGLATEQTHTVRVSLRRNLIIRLEDDFGHAIPETEYKIELFDGSVRSGRLGRGGGALIKEPPPGPFALVYPDHDDILAKSLAACLRESFDDHDTAEIFRWLQQAPPVVQKTIEAYEKYFNDYTGKGLIEDVYQVVTDPKALSVVEGLMAYIDLPTRRNAEVLQRLELIDEEGGDGQSG